jgi:hypothetical protein
MANKGNGKAKAKEVAPKAKDTESDNDSMDDDKAVPMITASMVREQLALDVALYQPCGIHSAPIKMASHLLRDCPILAPWLGAEETYSNDEDNEPAPPPIAKESYDSGAEDPDVLYVFTDLNKSEEKSIERVINATIPPVPQWLPWSEVDVNWTREDHPPIVQRPGWLLLVVKAQDKGSRRSRD